MKKHELFLKAYAQTEDEKERFGFLRGYLFALPPKEMARFMTDNFEAGFLAYEQVFIHGSHLEKLSAKAELDEHFARLKKRSVAAV